MRVANPATHLTSTREDRMPTQRQKNARQAELAESRQRQVREQARQRQDLQKQARRVGAVLPEKAKAQAEILIIGTGERILTSASAISLATALAPRPDRVLEVPVVDKRGKVKAAWLRAGAVGGVVDLTGLREFPR